MRAVIAGSGLTAQEIDDFGLLVLERYKKLGQRLPENHAWKEGKLIHALKGKEEATTLGPELGMNDLETSALGLLLFSHDIGRLVEGLRKEAGEPKPWEHGTDSVKELQALNMPGSSEFSQAMYMAIEHHADMKTPDLAACDNNEAGYALSTILRDLDKIAGFEKADKYVNDPGEKRRQIEVNWKKARETDPTVGEEHQGIVPESLLDIFESRQPLKRDDCLSYEAFMLQLMAWFFDVTNAEIYPHILATGGPRVLMTYFEQQFGQTHPDQLARIRAVVTDFGVD